MIIYVWIENKISTQAWIVYVITLIFVRVHDKTSKNINKFTNFNKSHT